MTLKNLMVHLSQSHRTPHRLEVAVALARKHDARLVGVFGQIAAKGGGGTWPPEDYRHARDASRAAFQAATAGLRAAEWVDLDRGTEAQILRHMVDRARAFDLVVMGQYSEPGMSFAPPDLCEEVVVNSGRPVLIIPYIGSYVELGRRPLVAWNNSRESARALNDALPVIEGCEEVVVFSAGEKAGGGDPHADVSAHLAAHGMKSKSNQVVLDEEIGVMDFLLDRASDLSVDLLVMGANAPEWRPFASHGTGTRYVLRHMTVPVLMSN